MRCCYALWQHVVGEDGGDEVSSARAKVEAQEAAAAAAKKEKIEEMNRGENTLSHDHPTLRPEEVGR
jgi:hypothetical protein